VNAPHDPIAAALSEDVGAGDLTAQFFTDPNQRSGARIFCKADAVLAGVETAREVFHRIDPALALRVVRHDGDALSPGDTVLEIEGSTASIVTAERTALNFIQRLSGVATLTRRYVKAVEGTGARILDTRKTTPGLRLLEKAAVAAGGGTNHRIGLYDMVMVKDNHLAARGDIEALRASITRFKAAHPAVRVELEADTLEQLRAFLGLNHVDVILLDNMDNTALRTCVELAAGRVQIEASGGVNLDTVRGIAETGVNFISVGALTHSAGAVDFSLEIHHA